MKNQKIIMKSAVMDANEDSDILDIARSKGIHIPSSHLGFFRTIYAHIDVANRNKVRLSREAVENALPTLIQAQVNFEHFRKGAICGQVLDAWINADDAIEVVFAFHKGVYEEKYNEAQDKIKKGELNVSFELLSDKSTQEFLADGTVRLNDVDFQGVGFLFDHDPADPDANVFEMAKVYKKRAEKIEEKNLVFAKEIIEQCNEILNHEENNTQEGGNPLMDKEQEKLVADLRIELEDFAKDISNEELLDEAKVEELRQLKADAEKKPEAEEKKEEKAEEKPSKEVESKEESEEKEDLEADAEPEKEDEKAEEEAKPEAEEKKEEKAEEDDSEEAKVEYQTETKEVVKESFDDNEIKTEVEKETVETVEVDGEPVEKVVTKKKVEQVITIADLEARVAELEGALKAKDSEIEEVRANAELIGKLKVELKDNPYVAKFKDEDYLDKDKLEKAKLSKERDDLKAENEELKKAKTEQTVVVDASEKKLIVANSDEEKTEPVSSILNKWYNRK